jgi:segregation and condensation protein A
MVDDAPALVLDLDGFGGPIDLLLTLAREQKVDLIHISILALAEQYLAFVAAAAEEHLDLAADYLVMAAWLAYLKSRLLLPVAPDDPEPSGAELAASLQFQLQRLAAMQKAGQTLMTGPVLGRAVFGRGAPDLTPSTTETRTVWDVTIGDLVSAYASQVNRRGATRLEIEPFTLFSVDEAMKRLERLLGKMPTWTTLASHLPVGLQGSLRRRSSICAHLIASLELVRQGRLDIRQDAGPFSDIHIRAHHKAHHE